MFRLYINKNAQQREAWLQYGLCRKTELDSGSAEQPGQEICLVFVVKPSSKYNKGWEKKGKPKQETDYFGAISLVLYQ